ncbi:MAG: hypothetical protein CVU63_16980, partial [Deltaproteobacteria bacterium HGW-Deltaproteobacteria-20]
MSSSLQSDLDALLSEVVKHYPETDTQPIARAFEGVTEHLDADRARRAMDAAMMLAGMRLDPAAVCACLVTTLRDKIPQPKLVEAFGAEIATIVEGVG